MSGRFFHTPPSRWRVVPHHNAPGLELGDMGVEGLLAQRVGPQINQAQPLVVDQRLDVADLIPNENKEDKAGQGREGGQVADQVVREVK